MKAKKQSLSPWLYGVAVLVLLCGMLISAWIFIDAGIGKYPGMIAEVYSEKQHRLSVPGSKEVNLTRTGAYGIYYQINPASASVGLPETPPAIDCSLTSRSTGMELQGVPDYVEGNRYWSKGQDAPAVLIMSLTVDEPDTYTFACRYQDGSSEPEILVALGPNYVWEFLRVAWKISLPLMGSISMLCGSVLLALIIVVVVAIKRRINLNQPIG